VLAHNKSGIPARQLRYITKTIEAQHREIEQQWFDYFGEIRYYC
jgi:hypothetical protein